MNLPPLEVDSVGQGCWLSLKAVCDLIEPMATAYQRRLGRYHIGDETDIAQAAHLRLLEWEAANGRPERVREIPALTLLHRAMVEEVKSNRKQSVGGFIDVGERRQLTPKQIEQLQVFVNVAAKAARSPGWEMLWCAKVLEWSADDISVYRRRKKDERRYYSPDEITNMVKVAVQRIKRKVPAELITDVRWLQMLP